MSSTATAAAPKEQKVSDWQVKLPGTACKAERHELKQQIVRNDKQIEKLYEENKKLGEKIEMLVRANATWQKLRIGEECQEDDPCSHEVWLDGKALGCMNAPDIVKLYELHKMRIPAHLLE